LIFGVGILIIYKDEVDRELKIVAYSIENDDGTSIQCNKTLLSWENKRPNQITSKLSHEKDHDNLLLNGNKLITYGRSFVSGFASILQVYPPDFFVFCFQSFFNGFFVDFFSQILGALNMVI